MNEKEIKDLYGHKQMIYLIQLDCGEILAAYSNKQKAETERLAHNKKQDNRRYRNREYADIVEVLLSDENK